MNKKRLFTPGPVSIPPEVSLKCAEPILHHRTPEFQKILKGVLEDLQYVFQTSEPVVLFAASGTGAMEASVSNLLSAGDKAIMISAGKFGERWIELGKAYGVECVVIELEYGQAVDPQQVETALKEHPDAKAVYATLCETSTATRIDLVALGNVVRQSDAVLVVDAVSALCAEELRTDEWGIDVVVSGSQKGLMMPPGLAFISVGARAQKLLGQSNLPKYYFSLEKALKSREKTDTPFTPAVSLVKGLGTALQLIREEGIENVWKRHAVLASATRAGVQGLGLEVFSQAPSNVVTAFNVPEGVDGAGLVKWIRDKLGVSFAGGQGSLKGKIVRVAHLGWVDELDIYQAMSALEIALDRNGYHVEFGAAVRAAEEAIAAESAASVETG